MFVEPYDGKGGICLICRRCTSWLILISRLLGPQASGVRRERDLSECERSLSGRVYYFAEKNASEGVPCAKFVASMEKLYGSCKPCVVVCATRCSLQLPDDLDLQICGIATGIHDRTSVFRLTAMLGLTPIKVRNELIRFFRWIGTRHLWKSLD
jgi:hypothetical protein